MKKLALVLLMALLSCQNENRQKSENENQKWGRLPLNGSFDEVLLMTGEHLGPLIGPGYPGTEDNKSGFETGQVVKLEGTYHMFVNEMYGTNHLDLRISHWTSQDGLNWQRESTIKDNVPGRSHENHRSEVWVTGVRFNQPDNRWNIFYIAYRGGNPDQEEIADADYEGQVWRAESSIEGRQGIAGPYQDRGIILKPDENSEWWEGQQGTASFHPYEVDGNWYGFYCTHNHYPPTPWWTGLAKAESLSGPWQRYPEKSPTGIEKLFAENPIVTQLPSGKYLAIYDVNGYSNRPGAYQGADVVAYSVSENGVDWPQGKPLVVQSDSNDWASDVRTPLGLIPEVDGSYTVFYTARLRSDLFWGIGKATVRILEKKVNDDTDQSKVFKFHDHQKKIHEEQPDCHLSDLCGTIRCI